jgi:hypothetical protein
MTDDIGTNRNNNLDDTSSDRSTDSDRNTSDENSSDKNSSSRTSNTSKTGSGSVPNTTGGDAEVSSKTSKPSTGTGTLDENEEDDSSGDMSEIEKRNGSNTGSQE